MDLETKFNKIMNSLGKVSYQFKSLESDINNLISNLNDFKISRVHNELKQIRDTIENINRATNQKEDV